MKSADDWVDGLLADLKCASTMTWEGGREAFRAMPNMVERVIRWHLDRIDSDLYRAYCEQALSHFERLVEQSERRSVRLLHAYDFNRPNCRS